MKLSSNSLGVFTMLFVSACSLGSSAIFGKLQSPVNAPSGLSGAPAVLQLDGVAPPPPPPQPRMN
jgi:hypothetical protein